MTTLDELFENQPIMAILRNMDPERSVRLSRTAWKLGISMVEVPIQTPDAVPSLEAVLAAGREEGRPVGAGTVTSVDQVELCEELGVAFTVAPGLDADVVAASERVGVPHLPGVATATEVQHAVRLGLQWVKAFPASLLGKDFFGAMSGPFPQVNFVATGGMSARNAGEFLDAGVRCVAVGSALEDEQQLPLLAELIGR
ncbi:bifunctional 4-hydroxy-2-oxoglutarate aldolase/2-dehydro-3-deoxy-phosphogluconate aldolase [Enemella evansiae]|uniref:bifunctional 4-hydroxy-2-oxoglutarate aldolase/2-dehydro-3-deoxy-phosphogluconate aldolase n=1 Tax=Enemella evansiae TaxID=2016499 RepID=UPI000B979DAC|nr:bifunctional 4-hydroxy-2-oxoglutarate aldolase/2-dehydro-3-deoxy-phosphogluconate aldolase [Enemella evansiae]PFG68700.1 2-keto-3-deoxy-phosphogluconate aldolase [Propionibacteriaceae bacterium ES.041]OYN94015.1 2-dehydro-3-deoxyphosphogluconate aldolase [Enemella evansiae]OYN95302.1 2-dehydro-3-deoxyphosphogluconate aldolase [Enemella evansiae]OYO03405.1 2-dehydro-3-deoxyphosphogluconate aldolase [Enemella evansiae]OYO09825.1 2-dehydro-3-deoxyphosphogluconate aldolase [Enemella evansiae]